jgi:hypothetical protein
MKIRAVGWGLVLLGVLAGAPSQAGAHPWPYRGPREAPPPPPVEHVVTRDGYVWIGGHYEWRHSHYIWADGHLVRERRGRAWHEGRWEQHGATWRWRGGSWAPHR